MKIFAKYSMLLFLCIYFSLHVFVIKIASAEDIITTVAGNGTRGFSGDGGPAVEASLNDPWGVFIDSIDNIFIADGANNRIRKVDTNGIITTIAGNGVKGFSGDGGLATDAF